MIKLDSARLDEVFPRALEDPEIKPHVGKTISQGQLQRAVREASAIIWDGASEALSVEESARDVGVRAQEAAPAKLDTEVRALIEKADVGPERIAAAIAGIDAANENYAAAQVIEPLLPKPGALRSSKLIDIPMNVFSGVVGFSFWGQRSLSWSIS